MSIGVFLNESLRRYDTVRGVVQAYKQNSPQTPPERDKPQHLFLSSLAATKTCRGTHGDCRAKIEAIHLW